MSKAFHEFSPYRTYPFDENKVRLIFDKHLFNPSEVIVILGCIDVQIVACLVASIAETYFGPTRIAGEIIWWVDPEYRSSRVGIKLHEAFEYWGNKVGADILQCVQTEETTVLVKFYNSQGYHLAESSYIKEI